MRHSIRFIILSALLFLSVPAFSAFAQSADNNENNDPSHELPLMVIRFNQAHLDYSDALYRTVSSALKVKPGAVFDIISVAPRADLGHTQASYDTIAADNAHKVLVKLNEIGLPAARVSLVKAVDNVPASEVRIFVH